MLHIFIRNTLMVIFKMEGICTYFWEKFEYNILMPQGISEQNSLSFIIPGGFYYYTVKSHITPPVFFTQFDQHNLGLDLSSWAHASITHSVFIIYNLIAWKVVALTWIVFCDCSIQGGGTPYIIMLKYIKKSNTKNAKMT